MHSTHTGTLARTRAHPGPDPSYEAVLRGGGAGNSSCVSPWKQEESSIFHTANCQRVRMNPHYGRQTSHQQTRTHTHTRAHMRGWMLLLIASNNDQAHTLTGAFLVLSVTDALICPFLRKGPAPAKVENCGGELWFLGFFGNSFVPLVGPVFSNREETAGVAKRNSVIQKVRIKWTAGRFAVAVKR